jgi:hypothetical protein
MPRERGRVWEASYVSVTGLGERCPSQLRAQVSSRERGRVWERGAQASYVPKSVTSVSYQWTAMPLWLLQVAPTSPSILLARTYECCWLTKFAHMLVEPSLLICEY